MKNKQSQFLRTAFAAGAITDALAVLPLVFPALAKILWGIEEVSGPTRFAMGYAAALMLGWTVLLGWAFQRPVERRLIATLTMLVIAGFVATEIIGVTTGSMEFARMLPSWIMQAILLVVFGIGYHYPGPQLLDQKISDLV